MLDWIKLDSEKWDRAVEVLLFRHYSDPHLEVYIYDDSGGDGGRDVEPGSTAGNADAAARIAQEGGSFVSAIPTISGRVSALSTVASALATAGRTAEAQRIAHEAEHLARTITDPGDLALALSTVASALATAGRTAEAQRIAHEAEHLARSITDPGQQAWALMKVAGAMEVAALTAAADRLWLERLQGPQWQEAVRMLIRHRRSDDWILRFAS